MQTAGLGHCEESMFQRERNGAPFHPKASKPFFALDTAVVVIDGTRWSGSSLLSPTKFKLVHDFKGLQAYPFCTFELVYRMNTLGQRILVFVSLDQLSVDQNLDMIAGKRFTLTSKDVEEFPLVLHSGSAPSPYGHSLPPFPIAGRK